MQGKQHALILQGEGKRRSKSSNSLDSVLCPYFLAAKSLQLCPTLCDPIDSSPPGSPVPGILQASSISKTHMYGFTFSFIGILFLHKSLKLILDFNLSETFYSTS